MKLCLIRISTLNVLLTLAIPVLYGQDQVRPSPCGTDCRAEFEAAIRRCVDAGGSRGRCTDRFRDDYRRCVADACPPTPRPCDADCRDQFEAASKRCVDAPR